jgi:hypothetical protein
MTEDKSSKERLTKRDVIQRLCMLAKEVGEAHECQLAYDCFCGHPDSYRSDPTGYRFEVLEFMEEAVREKIKRMRQDETTDHIANEWADMATNGIVWLRNIRDGISTPVEALTEMESNLQRIQKLRAVEPTPGQVLIVSAEEAKQPLAFRHRSKDPKVPYEGCHCDTCQNLSALCACCGMTLKACREIHTQKAKERRPHKELRVAGCGCDGCLAI